MRKWKKLLLPAMCAFMLQIPVIVNAEAVDSSNNVTSAVETPVATPTPALLNIINLRKKWKGICSQVPFIVLKYRQGCI